MNITKFLPISECHEWWIPRMSLFYSFCLPSRKAGGLQIPVFDGICDPRCQGIAVSDYSFTLDALAMKPSRFCSVGGKVARFHRFHKYLISYIIVNQSPLFCQSLGLLMEFCLLGWFERVAQTRQSKSAKIKWLTCTSMKPAGRTGDGQDNPLL